LFALLELLIAAAKKNRENALEDVALVAAAQQKLSNLYSLDIYGRALPEPVVFVRR
jgi:hypothetical protein